MTFKVGDRVFVGAYINKAHGAPCPVCGTHDDGPCFLIPIAGAPPLNAGCYEAALIHVKCMVPDERLAYDKVHGIIYMVLKRI